VPGKPISSAIDRITRVTIPGGGCSYLSSRLRQA
jgi:hypothetical protein